MFLAVYDLKNLLCPIKVLTHLDDIRAALDGSAVTCSRLQAPVSLHGDGFDEDAVLLEAVLPCLPADQIHRDVLRLRGTPIYADPCDEQVEPEAISGGPVTWHVVRGFGQLAMPLSETLAVLECGPADEIGLPAGARHWFRPRAGESCIIVRSAAAVTGLERPVSGGDLAARFPGLGL